MITIIIPTIGTSSKSYFESSLYSALKTKTFLVPKILIIDNSQKKDFGIYLRDIKKDERVEIVTIEERLSMANSWNSGLQKVETDWHLYLHDDDILNYTEFNKINLPFKKVGFISFDFNILSGENRKRFSRSGSLAGIIENTPKFVSTIFNTHMLKEIGGWDDNAGYFLDFVAFVKLEVTCSSLHISEVLGDYRIHSDNASAREKRTETYGEVLPYVVNECYKVISNLDVRREIVFHIVSFSFPHRSLGTRIINKIMSLLGKKAWFKN